MVWDNAECARLTALWNDGLSCSQIGAELGCSRNAVIGKVSRLGLPARKRREIPPRPRRPRSNPKIMRVLRVVSAGRGNAMRTTFVNTIEPETIRHLPPDAIPLEQRKQLLDLKPHHCRFPYGDPGTKDFFFCGADTDQPPYCAVHRAMAGAAYVPRQQRPRAPTEKRSVEWAE